MPKPDFNPHTLLDVPPFIKISTTTASSYEGTSLAALPFWVTAGSPSSVLKGRCPSCFPSLPAETDLIQRCKLWGSKILILWIRCVAAGTVGKQGGHQPIRTEFGPPFWDIVTPLWLVCSPLLCSKSCMPAGETFRIACHGRCPVMRQLLLLSFLVKVPQAVTALFSICM